VSSDKDPRGTVKFWKGWQWKRGRRVSKEGGMFLCFLSGEKFAIGFALSFSRTKKKPYWEIDDVKKRKRT